MNEELTISLVQTELHWENPGKNLEMFSRLLSADDLVTDLIVLPEMFNTGFTMKSSVFAEEMSGTTVSWMRKKAFEKNCVITGSLIIKENESFYNRLIWMMPDGNYHYYDKRHLFRMAGEHNFFTAGKEKVITTLKGWKIRPLICYDLRFPVWSRNKNDYDLLIYTANWPEKRSFAWKNLLISRAIENLSYVAGINRVGSDGNEILYSGDTAIIDPKGNYIATSRQFENEIITINLSYDELQDFRKSFPANLDADDFKILP